ncbi:MAG: monovalent cation/H+ antiporter subunit D family protein [Betaproteobacteria bacterium]|nr:MAG: monovalent cation/H+ antiporter subunit D family protein [Betaproteobacteria bacterium]
MLLAVAAPVLGALGVVAAQRHPNLREALSFAAAGIALACVLALAPSVLSGGRPEVVLLEILPGAALAFRLEPLGMLFALVAAVLWPVSTLYSIGYMRGNDELHQPRFFACFALAIACTLGLAFAANLLTLFLFYELLTLITYPLVTHHQDEEARHAGRVYLGYLMGTSLTLMLIAIVATWAVAGTVEFTPGGILGGEISNAAVGGLLALFVFGIGKAAVMPMHRWLPAAMVAPTPVSALLHAVAVVKAGVFSVVKVIVYIFGVDRIAGLTSVDWLPFVAGFTIIAASVVALRADNLKRRLAYSTISQLSYVVLAAALLTPLSVIGAALHIVTHAIGKITLFFAAGAIYTAAHKTQVSELDGIARRMPWTMGAFTVGALSLIGIPPAAGFFSKWYIMLGAAQGGHWAALTVLGLSTLLNAAYFLPIIYAAYFRAPADAAHPHGEAPWPMLAAMAVTTTLVLAFFCAADVLLGFAQQIAGGAAG